MECSENTITAVSFLIISGQTGPTSLHLQREIELG